MSSISWILLIAESDTAYSIRSTPSCTLSVLSTLMIPISPVVCTCVPAQASTSTPGISTTLISLPGTTPP
jgi:hypothetical protein